MHLPTSATLLPLALLASLATTISAAPTAPAEGAIKERRNSYFQAQIHFFGAADARYDASVPTDGSVLYLYNPLSVSYIASDGGATCTFYGVDGSVTTVVGAATVPVGPPQTQVSAACRAF